MTTPPVTPETAAAAARALDGAVLPPQLRQALQQLLDATTHRSNWPRPADAALAAATTVVTALAQLDPALDAGAATAAAQQTDPYAVTDQELHAALRRVRRTCLDQLSRAGVAELLEVVRGCHLAGHPLPLPLRRSYAAVMRHLAAAATAGQS